MGQQSECDGLNSLLGNESELQKGLTCGFSSNDDSSDSDGKKKKRMWKKSESTGKIKSHRKYLMQKFKPYHNRIIDSTVNQNFKSEFDDCSGNVSSNLFRTTIELKNVPAEMNNILQLFQCFSQFGEVTLVQINRNSDSRALLSFKTISEASLAMKKASSVIPSISVSWFVDYCLLKRFPRKISTKYNDLGFVQNYDSKYRDVPKLNNTDTFHDNFENIRNSRKKPRDVVNSISKLIKMKNKLLFDQLKSHNEIADKLGKCKPGSDREKMLLTLLKKVQEQINDNQLSIEHSLKQKTEIYSNSVPRTDDLNLNATSNQHRTRSWMEAFKNLKNCNASDLDFIPINLLDFGISFDKPEFSLVDEGVLLDTELNSEQNYFSSRSYGHTINICSPKKP